MLRGEISDQKKRSSHVGQLNEVSLCVRNAVVVKMWLIFTLSALFCSFSEEDTSSAGKLKLIWLSHVHLLSFIQFCVFSCTLHQFTFSTEPKTVLCFCTQYTRCVYVMEKPRCTVCSCRITHELKVSLLSTRTNCAEWFLQLK